jgi:hypothetical protein
MAEWDDILEYSDIEVSSLSSSSAVEEEPHAVVEAAQDAQQRIATYIGHPVMIHSHTQGIQRWEWTEDDVEDGMKAWADHQPVVEIESGDVGVRFGGDRLIKDYRDDLKTTYFAGYIREDQSLSDLPTSGGDPLEGLTTEPPTLPPDIRRVAIRLTLYELNRAEHRSGMGTTTASIGGGDSITIEGPDPGFPERQLSQLDPYRRPGF